MNHVVEDIGNVWMRHVSSCWLGSLAMDVDVMICLDVIRLI